MPSFWDSIGLNNNIQKQQMGFDLQGFMKFYQENKGQNPEQMLQQLLSSGRVTEEQYIQAKDQANNALQMMKILGLLK